MAARMALGGALFLLVLAASIAGAEPPFLETPLEPRILLVEHKAASEPARPKAPQYPLVVNDGTSATATRKSAAQAVPLRELSPEKLRRAREILGNTSFFRRLPTLNFTVDPQVYAFFTQHPEAAVSVWRAMQISKLQLWQTDTHGYEADVGDGSTGSIEVLQQSATDALVICDGLYKSPLFKKPIEAKSLVYLQTSFSRDASGTMFATHRADVFVSFPSQTIDMAARIFSPLAISMTDATFSEISLFLKMMSVAMTRRPEWVEGLAEKMDGVQEIRKKQLVQLTTQVYTQYQKRSLQQAEAALRASRDAIQEVSSTSSKSAKGASRERE